MPIYIAVAALIILLSSVELFKVSDGIKTLATILTVIVLVLFIGLRDQIGNDWIVYKQVYDEIQTKGDTDEKFEIGFKVLNLLISKIGFNFNQFIFTLALLSIIIKVKAFKRLTDKYLIALVYYLAYFLTEYEMSGLRQAFALAFSFLSIPYIIKKDLKSFLITVIIGSSFHVSILFFLPAYFLNRIRLTTESATFLMILSVSLVFFDVSGIVIKLSYLIPGGTFAMEKIQSYSALDNSYTGITLGHVIYLSLGTLFLFFRKSLKSEEYDLYLNIFIIGLAFSFLFSGSLGVLNRATYYYLGTGGLLFSIIISKSGLLFRIIIFSFLATLFAVKVFESITDPNFKENYIPYKSSVF